MPLDILAAFRVRVFGQIKERAISNAQETEKFLHKTIETKPIDVCTQVITVGRLQRYQCVRKP